MLDPSKKRPLISFQLDQINQKLDTILKKELEIMSQFTDLEDLISAINDATNEQAGNVDKVAAKIDGLIAQIGVGALSADQVATVVAQLTAERDALIAQRDKLAAIGADPVNPIP